MLPAPRLPRLTLRNRLTLSVVLIALISTVGVAAVAFFYARANALAEIASDQMQRTVAVAEAVDQKFISRRLLLATFAESLQTLDLRDTAQFQPFLRSHASLRAAFDSIAIADLTGRVVANYNGLDLVAGLNVSDRPYFRTTVSTGVGLISQPIRNRATGVPQVVVTQPIRDGSGALVYLLSGLISLEQSSFLADVARLKFGRTGYIFITNTDGIVIDSPRKERILKHFDAEGGYNEATTRAVAGFEGTTEAVNRLGVHALYAFKQTKQTNWIIGSHYPRQEALAPLRRVERLTWLGAVGLSMLVGVLSLLALRSQLAPLGRLHRHMLASHASGQYTAYEAVHSNDELGDLARTFDRLMTERHAAEMRVSASLKLLQNIADNLPALIARLDADERYTFVNAAIQKAHVDEHLIGKSMAEVRGPGELAIVGPWVRRALAGEFVTFEKDGAPGGPNAQRRFEVTYIPDRDDNGVVTGFFSMSFDITERKRAEQVVAASEAKLRGVTDNLPALVAHLDKEQRFTFVSAAVGEWWGMEAPSLIGRTMLDVVGDAVYPIAAPWLERALAGERVEFDVQRSVRGALRDVHNVYVPDKDENGTVQGVFTLSVNISALKAVERQLTLLARVDPLTNLPNRLAFNEALPLMLARARRSGDAVALMYLDIDHFKTINDTLGHAAGDLVLCEFSRRLQASVRTTDLVARLAGDEFVVVLENLSSRDVTAAVAQKIVAQVSRPVFEVAHTEMGVTTSIGIAFHSSADPPVTAAALLALADAALYAAKASGRNTFEFAA